MERCTIVRWGIVFCLLSCCGCSMTRGMNTASWWRGNEAGEKKLEDKEKVASGSPFKRKSSKHKQADADSKKVADADKKPADKQPDSVAAKPADPKPRSDAPAAKVATHDAETLKLIEEELKDAAPEERERLYAEWKPLDSAMVKQVIRIRRMVRQMSNTAPDQQLAQASMPDSAGPRIEPRTAQSMGAGHASGQLTQAAGRIPTSPLGVSPWGQPGDPNASSQYGALNTMPQGTNGSNPYGSFDQTSPPSRSTNGSPIHLASNTQPGSQGFGYRQDSATQSAFASYPTATPVGVTPIGTTNNSGTPGAPGGFGQLADAQQRFSGAVSSNGGPQIIAGTVSGGLSPYYPPTQNAQPPVQGNIIPVAAQSAERPQGLAPAPPGSPAAVQGIVTPQSPATAQPSGLAAFGVGRFFNAAPQGTTPVPTSAGHLSPVSAKWNEDLQRLIASAAAEVAQTGPGGTDVEKRNYIEKHVYLRMLFLMAGQQVRAMEPIPAIEPAEQEFWQQIFWGISSYFDSEAIPDPQDRATQTTLQLRGALQRLQDRARLELRNVNFCHKISSFGNYERFQRDEFSPGQPVLIYAEVSNFKSEQSADGPFRTVLKSTIEIFNSRGEPVQKMPFPPTEDLCQNQRRDYFHSYEFTVPQRIAIGPHVMKLTVEDQISQKLATYTLNFTVK